MTEPTTPRTREQVLVDSLARKQQQFDNRFAVHFDEATARQGQPWHDNAKDRSARKRLDRQDAALHTLKESIQKTEDALARERRKVAAVERTAAILPAAILEALESGTLSQWRRHPTTFFVHGVERARLVWDVDRQQLTTRYLGELKEETARARFLEVARALDRAIKEQQATSKP
jgi:hypothetical protein